MTIDPIELALAIAAGILIAKLIAFLAATVLATLDVMLQDSGTAPGAIHFLIGVVCLIALSFVPIYVGRHFFGWH